jgi:hypothetical protein
MKELSGVEGRLHFSQLLEFADFDISPTDIKGALVGPNAVDL